MKNFVKTLSVASIIISAIVFSSCNSYYRSSSNPSDIYRVEFRKDLKCAPGYYMLAPVGKGCPFQYIAGPYKEKKDCQSGGNYGVGDVKSKLKRIADAMGTSIDDAARVVDMKGNLNFLLDELIDGTKITLPPK